MAQMACTQNIPCRTTTACTGTPFKPCTHHALAHRAGTEYSHCWPGFFEGAIVTGEEVAAELDRLLMAGGASGAMNAGDAWELPRTHTERLMTGFHP